MNIAEYNSCVEKYLKMVYRISFHYFGNREDAEDVSQDVFTKLFSSTVKFISDEDVKAWLIRVTTNMCHSYYRNPFRRRRTEIDETELENIADISSSEQRLVDRKVVIDAVMSLPEHYRIIVYLFYYEEYSIHQISSILKIKETTIQTRLSRAREKLRNILSDSFEEGVLYELY